MSKVILLKVEEYDAGKVGEALREGLALLGLEEEIAQENDNVLVKPNMLTFAAPEAAVCSHPVPVAEMIKILQGRKAKVSWGDSPGFGSVEKVAGKTGFSQICRELGVEIVSFKEEETVSYKEGKTLKNFPLALEVRKADKIINMAKLKTHGLTRYTGGVKNLFGCLPGRNKPAFHLRMKKVEDFAAMLVDLYSLISPHLTVIDGIVAMEGPGPRNGTPRKLGALIMSQDAVAADAVATALIELDPLQLPVTRIAQEHGVGIADPKDIEILGEDIESLKVKDFKQTKGHYLASGGAPTFIASLLRGQLTATPIIDQEKCTACGVCAEACPPEVIKVHCQAEINYEGCIRCYCCQELCPHNAIELKQGLLQKILRF